MLFLGTGDFGVPALHALRAAGHEIVAAVSQPDRPAGRSRQVQPTPIHAAAAAAGLPHIQAEDVNTQMPGAVLRAAEIGVVVAFGQKLGPGLLASVPRGFVNIHGSLLPRFRGAAPYQWAILSGESVTGVTTFQLDQRWDNGPIWGRRETPIGESETADELHDRLALLGAELIVETLASIARGDAQPQPQLATLASRAPKLSKADSRLDWTLPAAIVCRRIHGLWSWPAAATVLAGKGGRRERVALARARVASALAPPASIPPPGSVLADRTIQTGSGSVELLEVKPEGGRLMSFAEYANGRRLAAGDRFEALALE